MTADGTKKFADATKAAYPNHDVIYIVYDNQVISAPSVQAEITDGKAVINGMSSLKRRKGRFYHPYRRFEAGLEELRSNVVGAQLGSAAVRTA
ncbi:MAG: SecDF P1 head subdomain-containing protein [Gallintestinimicrobium sp.]